MCWTRREIQYDRACSIAITGNFQATSETIPQNFHKSSRVSSARLGVIGISGEIDSKSIPGEAPGLPKSSQNRSRDPLGTPGDTQERSRSVFGASWGVPGVLREHPESLQSGPARPERASGSIRERAKAARINAKSRPGMKKHVFLARLVSEAAS